MRFFFSRISKLEELVSRLGKARKTIERAEHKQSQAWVSGLGKLLGRSVFQAPSLLLSKRSSFSKTFFAKFTDSSKDDFSSSPSR